MSFETVLFSKGDDGIARVSLNRPRGPLPLHRHRPGRGRLSEENTDAMAEVANLFTRIGTDSATFKEGQKRFESGQRPEWRLR